MCISGDVLCMFGFTRMHLDEGMFGMLYHFIALASSTPILIIIFQTDIRLVYSSIQKTLNGSYKKLVFAIQ